MTIESPPDLNTIAYIYGPLYQEVISYERIPELDEQYNEVMTTVTSCLQNHTTFPIESAQRLDSILMAYFKRICLSKISALTKKLPKGKSYSFPVSKYNQKLHQLKTELEINTTLSSCREILLQLKEIEKTIDDELIIEKYQNTQFWKGVIYGAIIGYLGGIASSLTLDYFKRG